MSTFNFVLLHVTDETASAAFYSETLGIPIIEEKPGFAMLPLSEGVMLGLWQRDTVAPSSSGQSGASEIGVGVADDAAVAALHAAWHARGVTILQAPAPMPFGMTFVAQDADGHRLRVTAPPVG